MLFPHLVLAALYEVTELLCLTLFCAGIYALALMAGAQ